MFLLAFDLDGTLITDGGLLVPDDTRAALDRLRALGGKVAVITGRDFPPPGVLEAARPDAVATNNGGRVEVNGQVHLEARFSPEELSAVLAHGLAGARVIAFTPERLYVDLPPGEPVPEWLQRRDHAPLAEAPRDGILKIGFYHEGVGGWRDALRGTHPQLVYTGAQDPYPSFLTVTPAGAHKGAALALCAEVLGVDMARTIAFGDSDNDEAMLEVAGHAVQVGRLPLLARHAHDRVAGPEALGGWLHALADRLERGERVPTRAPVG